MLADAHISSMGYLWYYAYTMHSLKIVWSCRTVGPSGNQRSVKYGTEIIASNMVWFLKWTLRSVVIVRVELNWHSSLLMVTCPASKAFFVAWLLAFSKCFSSLSVAYLVNVYVKKNHYATVNAKSHAGKKPLLAGWWWQEANIALPIPQW